MNTSKIPLVLVVDDSSTNLNVASRMLTMVGCKVDTAADGPATLLKCNEKKYDLILLDWNMPQMSGPQAAQLISQRWPEGERPKIYVLTASRFESIEREFKQSKFDGYLPKPLMLHDVKKLIASLSTETGKHAAEGPQKLETHSVNPSPGTSTLMDIDSFLANFEGITEVIPTTIDQFLLQKNTLLASIAENLKSRKASELRINAHTLKGSIAIFRANSLIALASAIEEKAAINDLATIQDLLFALQNQLDLLVLELQDVKKKVKAA